VTVDDRIAALFHDGRVFLSKSTGHSARFDPNVASFQAVHNSAQRVIPAVVFLNRWVARDYVRKLKSWKRSRALTSQIINSLRHLRCLHAASGRCADLMVSEASPCSSCSSRTWT
jgi:hypothetical protein